MAGLRYPVALRPTDSVQADELNTQWDAAGGTAFGNAYTAGRLGAEVNALAAEEVSLRARGNIALADQNRQQIDALQRKAGVYTQGLPMSPSRGEVSLRNVGTYIGAMAGQGAASMQDPVLAAAGLGLAGRVLTPISAAIGRVTQLAAPFAAYGIGQRQLTGEAYNSMVEDPELMARTTPQQREVTANLYGAGGAALDTILPARIGSRFAGAGLRKGISPASTGGRIARDLAIEGGTEAAQEFGKQQTLGALNPNRDTSGDTGDLIDSAIGGAIGAGPLSAPSVIADNAARRVGDTAAKAEIAGRKVLKLGKDGFEDVAGGPVGDAAKGAYGKAKDFAGRLFGRGEQIDLRTAAENITQGLRDAPQKIAASNAERKLLDAQYDEASAPPGTYNDKGEFNPDAPGAADWFLGQETKRQELINRKLAELKDNPEAQAMQQKLAATDPARLDEQGAAYDEAAKWLLDNGVVGKLQAAADSAAQRLGSAARTGGEAALSGAKKAGKAAAGFAKNVAEGYKKSKRNEQGTMLGSTSEDYWSYDQWLEENADRRGRADKWFKPSEDVVKSVGLAADYMGDAAEKARPNVKNVRALARELTYAISQESQRASRGQLGQTNARLDGLAAQIRDVFGPTAEGALDSIVGVLAKGDPSGKLKPGVDSVIKYLKRSMTEGSTPRSLVDAMSIDTEKRLKDQGINVREPEGEQALRELLQSFAANGDAQDRKALAAALGGDDVLAKLLDRIDEGEPTKEEMAVGSEDVEDAADAVDETDDDAAPGKKPSSDSFEGRMLQKALDRNEAATYHFMGGAKRSAASFSAKVLDEKTTFFRADDPKLMRALESIKGSLGPEEDARPISLLEFAQERGIPRKKLLGYINAPEELVNQAWGEDAGGMSARVAARKLENLLETEGSRLFTIKQATAAPRDGVSMQESEFRALAQAGARAAEGVRDGKRTKAQMNEQYDARNFLFFPLNNDLGTDMPILAGNLATWGMKRLSDQQREDFAGNKDQEYLAGLIEGISAMLSMRMTPREDREGTGGFRFTDAPYRVTADGKVESFNDAIPPSLKLRTGRYSDLKAAMDADAKERARKQKRMRVAIAKEIDAVNEANKAAQDVAPEFRAEFVKDYVDRRVNEVLDERAQERAATEVDNAGEIGDATERLTDKTVDEAAGDKVTVSERMNPRKTVSPLREYARESAPRLTASDSDNATIVDERADDEARGVKQLTDKLGEQKPPTAPTPRLEFARKIVARMTPEEISKRGEEILKREAAERKALPTSKLISPKIMPRSPVEEAIVQRFVEQRGEAIARAKSVPAAKLSDKARARVDARMLDEDYRGLDTVAQVDAFLQAAGDRLDELRAMNSDEMDVELATVLSRLENLLNNELSDLGSFYEGTDGFSELPSKEAQALSDSADRFRKPKPAPEVAGGMLGKRQSAPAGRQSAQKANTRFKAATQAEMDAAKEYVAKVLGPKVKVAFEKITGYSGEWIEADNAIKISTVSKAGAMQVAYHEALHALWSRLGQHQEVRDLLTNVTSNPAMLQRLKGLLAGHDKAIAQLGDAEERVAYAYQFWAAGLLDVGQKADTWFRKLKRFFRTVFGMVRDDERAADIFEAFHKGAFAEPSAVGQVLAPIMERGTNWGKFRRALDKQIIAAMRYAAPASTVLATSESKTAREIATMFWTNPGDEKVGTKREGLLNAQRRVMGQYLSSVSQALEGLSPRDLNDVVKYLQRGDEPTARQIPYEPHRSAVKRVRALLEEYHKYATDAGVKLGYLENYFPRTWSVARLIEKHDEFVAMLTTKYAETMGNALDSELRTFGAADARFTDIAGAAEFFYQKLVASGGVENKLDASREDGVLTPFFEAENTREFKWLNKDDAEPFLDKDLIGQLTRYFRQGVRAAEYTRMFGRGSSWDTDTNTGNKLAKALGYWEYVEGHVRGNRDKVWIKGDVELELEAAAVKKEIPEAERADWVKRRMKAIEQATGAMEGVLGKDIDPTWRKVTSWAMVYQNIRLLPLALFSSIVDPLGIVARGGSMNDAYDGFVRGMRDVFRTYVDLWKDEPVKRTRDEMEKLAEDIGSVDSQHFLDSLGQAYASEYLDETARRVNNKVFTLNGMEAWNRAMRVQATAAAVRFIEQQVNKPGPDSERWLRELGLDAKSVPMKNGKLITNKNELGIKDPVAAKAAISNVHHAINRWVEGAVLTPNAAQRPAWASNPNYAFIFHLKQFTYSFHQTIMKRAVNELQHGNLGPMAAFIWYVPVMIASDVVKGLIQGGGELPAYMKGYSLGDWVMHGLQRSGLLTVGQIGIDAAEDPASILGPSIEQVSDAVFDPIDKTIVRALPANALYREALQ